MGMIISCLSNVMYLSEKITLWLTCVGLISCLIITFVVTLGMGVGLGYNYCFVDLKTRYKHVPAHYIYPGSPRWPHQQRAKAEPENAADEDEPENALRAPLTLPPLAADYLELFTNNINRTDLGPDGPGPTSPTPDYTFIVSKDWMTSSTISPEETSKTFSREFSPATSDRLIVFKRVSNNFRKIDNDTDRNVEIDDETNKTIPSHFRNIDNDTNRNVEMDDDTNEAVPSHFRKIDNDTDRNVEIDDETNEAVPSPIVSNNDPTSRRVKKLVIPISGLDLISLLSKLKAENKNYSLQIVTT